MGDLISTVFGNALIGIAFLILAALLTCLMFYAWKFPFDQSNFRSAAPSRILLLHRTLGYLFVIIYLFLMWDMVPRLWSYQIELPARTVLHLALGIAIGALLLVKLAIVRFFKHLEAKLVPALGTGIFLCTFLLIALVMPFALRDAYLEQSALGDSAMVESRINRVRDLLPTTGLQDEQLLAELSSRRGLISGRRILAAKCVQCHDLRTVLARPRTPQAWRQTVARMANRSTILNPITDRDQWFVTAYLIAVSPTLQETLKQRRQMQSAAINSQTSMQSLTLASIDTGDYDRTQAQQLFESKCSQCHSHSQIEQAPPASRQDAITLVQRMVGNGLAASAIELNSIIRYIADNYVDTAAIVPVAQAESNNTGAELYLERRCAGCHGADGRAPASADFPRLAGQSEAYLVRQFKDIRNGGRSNALASTMRNLVQDVSDDEIVAIARYLAAQK